MGKRGVALAVAAVALSGWGLQAQAAGQAVTGVTLGWAGQQIRVAWTDSAPMANTVTLSTGKVLGTTAAADANELLVDRAAIGMTDNQFDRQTVSVSDSSGGSATSPIF